MSEARDRYYFWSIGKEIINKNFIEPYVSELEQKIEILTDSNIARDLLIQQLEYENKEEKENHIRFKKYWLDELYKRTIFIQQKAELIGMFDDAMGLLMNYEQHADPEWQREKEELINKYNKE